MHGRDVGTGEGFEARCVLEFRCPFCPTATAVHVVEIPEGEKYRSGVMHDVPACAEFDKLEPEDFLRAAKRRMQS